jgi:N-acetylglucosaminyl-diphospho-decaprenol L-rhamnosyltransferase
MPPDLDVIVVTYNSVHVIGNLLDSLPRALGALTADVIVVDNGSTDGTVDLVTARGDCKVVRSANVGFAGGINRGVREGESAEAILVLNPDLWLGENAIPPLLKALHEPNVGIVAPQVRSPQGKLEFSLRREPSLLNAAGLSRTGWPMVSEHLSDPADYARPRVVDWALGAVLLISRGCYDLLGGWDESFFLFSEETDFCLRARDLGLLTWYEPQSVAVHIGGGSGRSGKTYSMQMVNRVRLYRRRHTALASWFYYGLTVARELSWIVRGHRESRSALVAILRPARRPVELGCSGAMMPR